MNEFEEKNALLGEAFDRYVREHEDFADQIPLDAVIVLQIEGDEGFNAWARRVSEFNRQEGEVTVYVHVKGFKPPPYSRLIDPVIRKTA